LPYCIHYSSYDPLTQRIVSGPWAGGCQDCSFPSSSSSSSGSVSSSSSSSSNDLACISCANIYKVLPVYVLDSDGNPGLQIPLSDDWNCDGQGVLPPQAKRSGGEWLFLVPRDTVDGASMNGILSGSILGALGTMTWNGVGEKDDLSSYRWNFVEYVQAQTVYEIRGSSWKLGQDILETICFGETISDQSSSSSSVGSSSSSVGSSSSSVACGPFNLSVTTQLGLNPENPDLFFGENVGVSVVSLEQVTLSYDDLNVSGLPFVMNVEVEGNLVATANMAPNYLNRQFSFTYQGVTYCGTFVSGTVSF